MSLPPVIYRDIGEEVPASDRLIYAAFVRHLDSSGGAGIARAVLRAARDCGVSRIRAWAVVRANKPDLFDAWLLDSNPSDV